MRTADDKIYGFKIDSVLTTNSVTNAANAPTFSSIEIGGITYNMVLTTDNTPLVNSAGNKVLNWGMIDGNTNGYALHQIEGKSLTISADDKNNYDLGSTYGNEWVRALGVEKITPYTRSNAWTMAEGTYNRIMWMWSSETPLPRGLYRGWRPSDKSTSAVFPVVDSKGNHIGWYPRSNAMIAEQDEWIAGIEGYFVIVSAGQSNSCAYGEGTPDYLDIDAPDIRIKQLAHRAYAKGTALKTGVPCSYNDVIPLDHCPHDAQDMSGYNHPKIAAGGMQYGCHGQMINVAKRLLHYIPKNYGILVVPCGYGGTSFAQTTTGTFSESNGVTAVSGWGVGKALYQNLVYRTRKALDLNPKNKLLCVIWQQGEHDVSGGNTNQPTQFNEMVADFRTQIADLSAQCITGKAENVKWLCGDMPLYWKNEVNADIYSLITANYENESNNTHFVPFMTYDGGQTTPSNRKAEDPDYTYDSGLPYYGSTHRTSANWVATVRQTHFSTKAHQQIIAPAYVEAILKYVPELTSMAQSREYVAPVYKGYDAKKGTMENQAIIWKW